MPTVVKMNRRAFREEWTAVVATLARRLGDLQRAEDATQEALAKAAATWPRDGVPAKPGAWLTVTAWRTALDQLRRDRRRDQQRVLPDSSPSIQLDAGRVETWRSGEWIAGPSATASLMPSAGRGHGQHEHGA